MFQTLSCVAAVQVTKIACCSSIVITGFQIDTEEAGNLLPGLVEQLIGQKVEETRSFDLTFPDTWQQNALRGVTGRFEVRNSLEPGRFRRCSSVMCFPVTVVWATPLESCLQVVVKELFLRVLPELDDSLAGKLVENCTSLSQVGIFLSGCIL